jgi:hypothetical protein
MNNFITCISMGKEFQEAIRCLVNWLLHYNVTTALLGCYYSITLQQG